VLSESESLDVACVLMRQEQVFPFSMVMDLLKIVTFLSAIFIQKCNITFQPCKFDAMLVSFVSSVLWTIRTLPAHLECSFLGK